MFNQDSVRNYIIKKLGGLRAETKMQKSNKNKESKNESPSTNNHLNLNQTKDNSDNPKNYPKDN